MLLVQEGFDRVHQGIELRAKKVLEVGQGAEEMGLLLGPLPRATIILEIEHPPPDHTGQCHCWEGIGRGQLK
jgi:hypothetical protein